MTGAVVDLAVPDPRATVVPFFTKMRLSLLDDPRYGGRFGADKERLHEEWKTVGTAYNRLYRSERDLAREVKDLLKRD